VNGAELKVTVTVLRKLALDTTIIKEKDIHVTGKQTFRLLLRTPCCISLGILKLELHPITPKSFTLFSTKTTSVLHT
jgi:hypothetical protein